MESNAPSSEKLALSGSWFTKVFILCQIDMKLPVTSAFAWELKEIVFLKSGIQYGESILFLLWLGRTSWIKPPVCMIQIVVKVQPKGDEQVKLVSIAHFTRWPLTNIPQSAWSHPSKLYIGYWSKMLSFVHTLIFVFPNDYISSQGLQELSLAKPKPNLFPSIISYFLYLGWLFWESLDNEIWASTSLVAFYVLFCFLSSQSQSH